MNKKVLWGVMLLLCLVVAGGCDKVNNKEVPSYMVNIDLGTYATWNVYGVTGVGDYRIFDRGKRLPANFPFTVNTYTGYGGVLLMMGLDSGSGSYVPLAYDAACPVENSPTVSISIDATNFDAVCPQCHSRYNVLTGMGGPKGGVALTSRYGLRTYKAHSSGNGGYIITSR